MSHNRLSRKRLHLINVYSNHNIPQANLNNRVYNEVLLSDWVLAECLEMSYFQPVNRNEIN